ncbi:Rho-binding antiterminator [Flammeovirga sp. OC4]|uniref:Rho-binding antiterminator n=1 Tax=Flammeovirga sp. OC4 TaxID=1382345 RepID=UPI0005C62CF0|nr:Rho-binding antiterminator [Flammeovirga sp. OC4]
MSKNKNYQPIACATYDQYEIWAMHQTLLHFQLKEREVKAVIKTLVVEKKVEYAVLDNGEKVRLDEIVKVVEVL